MPFQLGNKLGTGRPKTKPMTDAIRTMIFQPTGPKGHIGRPKKQNALQAMVRQAINDAIDGDKVALQFIANRLEGAVPHASKDDIIDQGAPQDREMALKEIARTIGFALLSCQTEPEPEVIEN